ncbi:MAG: ArsR family transcriptional regulator [Candidatus Nanopelagicales bacterium]|nr:ArsR family transcriptional regulator [Candidatus Nanopelagicales bacterium]
MKFPGEAAERVARSLLAEGPGTPVQLAARLGLSTAAIRKSLAALQADGLVSASERAPYGPAPAKRRGRPSHVFSLTPRGRTALNQDYDDLAIEALRFVAQAQGPEGIEAFAAQRAHSLMQQLQPIADTTEAAVHQLAGALTAAGYAATVEQMSDGGLAVQLCQHHCPIVDAAAEFPVLCEAETHALGEALGMHVTRLATLAHGDGVCTTVIPLVQRKALA